MAARLVGLIASRGDDLRAQLLAAGALDGLMTALGAMDAVASAGGPLPVLLMRLIGQPSTWDEPAVLYPYKCSRTN